MIVRWPGQVADGSKNNNSICASDILATLAELIGYALTPNEGEDSYSFLGNIRDVSAPQVRQSMILAGGSCGAMIAISNNWKFIEAADSGKWPETYYPNGPSKFERQLYNLADDKSEQNNLCSSNPEKVSELEAIITLVKSQTKTEGKTVSD
jgi:arylsulfatase A-like enzyme